MTAPKPRTPLTDKIWEVTYRDGKVYSWMAAKGTGLALSFRLEQDRARLIGALKEISGMAQKYRFEIKSGQEGYSVLTNIGSNADFALDELGELE